MASRDRHAARAIILTPSNEILLLRMAFPWREEEVWILPGGGIEAGEDAQTAVIREIYEETGGTGVRIVGEAWHRETYVEAMNTRLMQRYFLVQADQFEPQPTDLSEQEMQWVREYRWWSLTELLDSSIEVEPVNIARGIQTLINEGVPAQPIAIDGA